jgi:hypothetical protein
MKPERRQLTIAFIESAECDWPATVKERAKEIIKLTADLQVKRHQLADLNMMEASKINLMQEVAGIHQLLANAYRNMSKELVYHLSRIGH